MEECKNAAALPPTPALAYLGDAVHALYVRQMLVREGIPKSGALNARALEYITAPAQARLARRILPLLTQEEADVYRRAGNHRLERPKHATAAEYRAATGFEAVLGMLYYLGRTERLQALLDAAHANAEPTP